MQITQYFIEIRNFFFQKTKVTIFQKFKIFPKLQIRYKKERNLLVYYHMLVVNLMRDLTSHSCINWDDIDLLHHLHLLLHFSCNQHDPLDIVATKRHIKLTKILNKKEELT